MPERRILYVTGTRADFGLMASTLHRIAVHPGLTLQIAVTGMHLRPECGMTVTEIEASGLSIVARIPTDVGLRTAAAMSSGIGQAIIGLTRVLEEEKPDLLLVIGDRGEMLAGAIAALHLGVPIVHLHGGERSGTVDEPVRHALTKLSHWHFVATEESRERVIRMGEKPEHVWVTGAPSLDDLQLLYDFSRATVAVELGLSAEAHYALVLFHPVVQESQGTYEQTTALLSAIRQTLPEKGIEVIWLDPNADAGSAEILRAVEALDIRRFAHLPRSLYLAALRNADVLIGNSSSGVIEAASFGTPVVNIGNRQRARQRNVNTIDSTNDSDSIAKAIRSGLDHGRFPPGNFYGDGQAGARIVHLLATQSIAPDILDKVNTY